MRASFRGALLVLICSIRLGATPNFVLALPQHDNSDWWSLMHADDDENDVKFEKREFEQATFRILGIELGETMFSKAKERLGTAATIQRGDASSGRTQACYVSPPAKEQVHLTFEQGEVNFGFYLFAGGPSWSGSDRCFVTSKVSRDTATEAGVRLGQTRAEVVAILGRPSRESKDTLTYSFSVRKKSSPTDLKQARLYHPELDDKDLVKEFGFYDLNAGIVARFEQGKLTYLAVSKSETN